MFTAPETNVPVRAVPPPARAASHSRNARFNPERWVNVQRLRSALRCAVAEVLVYLVKLRLRE